MANSFTEQAPAPVSPGNAPGPPPATNGATASPAMSNAFGAPAPAQGAPSQPPMPMAPPSPDDIKGAHAHLKVMIADIMKLVDKPRGTLTKKDVFDAASDMIAKGAFQTPEAKQNLIAELANMPDDEPDIRKALGGFLLTALGHQDVITKAFGGPSDGV